MGKVQLKAKGDGAPGTTATAEDKPAFQKGGDRGTVVAVWNY